MVAGSCAHDEAGELLERFVSAYNAGVRTRDFGGFLALLTDDAVLDFEGIPDRGPVSGKAAIAQRFRDDPPDDQVCVRRWKTRGAQVLAEFGWADIPEGGGCLLLVLRERQVTRITIALGGPHRLFR